MTRCLTGPTCVLPDVKTRRHTCPVCKRIWLARNDGHGPYWHHDAKAVKR